MRSKTPLFALWMIIAFGFSVSGESLFLLTGSSTPKSTETFESALYQLRPGADPALAKVGEVMAQTEYILEDPNNRLLILADMGIKRKRIEFIAEDTPDKRFGLDVPILKDGWFVTSVTVLSPSSGSGALALGLVRRREDGIMEHEAWGMSTNSPEKGFVRLSPELLKQTVAAGKSGLVDIGTTDVFTASVRDDTGTLQYYLASTFVPSGVAAPPGLMEPRKFGFVVWGLNQELVALTVREISTSRQPIDKSGVWVLNRLTGKWTSIPTPHPTSEVRTLGSWVAIAETEPAEKAGNRPPSKARKIPTTMGPAIAHRMEYRHISLPGRLTLFHVTDGQQIRIETGEDDTEVLAIHDGSVYYRVNDALWQAQLLKDKLAPATLVYQGPVIGDVHWIFWGPDTTQAR